jgi:hypothetical protein
MARAPRSTKNRTESIPPQRKRLCLLKGCEQWFQPKVASSRYCSPKCRQKARQWSKKRSAERYRRSAKGKAARRKQAAVRRQRCKEQRTESPRSPPSVGDHNECEEGFICARPGCYERVTPTDRSPLKKYCCRNCYAAMRRVLERERRQRQRTHERQRRVADIAGRSASHIVTPGGGDYDQPIQPRGTSSPKKRSSD